MQAAEEFAMSKYASASDRCNAMLAAIDSLRAQVAALEQDAKRYRWLRSRELDDPEIWIAVDSVNCPSRWGLGGDDPDGCDAAIDAAMG